MIWQDLVFGAGQIAFAIALIPALRSATKPPRVTCMLTGGVLCAFALTFTTLSLTWSAATSLGCGAMWLALAVQAR